MKIRKEKGKLSYIFSSIEEINQYCYSDANGFYRIYLPEAGAYQLQAELFGYFDFQSEEIYVASADTVNYNILLNPEPIMGVLEGYVVSEEGMPLSNATLKPIDIAVGEVNSDENGYYIFPQIPGGYTYDIKVTHENYVAKIKTVEIPINENITLNFELAFQNSFENDDGDFAPEWEWEWGIPEPSGGPELAYDGEKVWGTDLDGYYDPSKNQSLITPDYYLAYDKDDYKLSFYHWYETAEGWDGGNYRL